MIFTLWTGPPFVSLLVQYSSRLLYSSKSEAIGSVASVHRPFVSLPHADPDVLPLQF
jgi:hypothetical protein